MTDLLTSTNGVHDDPEPIRIAKTPTRGRPIGTAVGRMRDRLLAGETLSMSDVDDPKALSNAVQSLRKRLDADVKTEYHDGKTFYSATMTDNSPPSEPEPKPAAKPAKRKTAKRKPAPKRTSRFTEATVGDLLLGDRLQVTEMSLDAGVRRITLVGERGMVLRFSADDPS